MALTTVPASLSATALTLTTAAQPNITSVGTLTGLTVSGNIAGTLTTAAQTNITSLGTLTSLTVDTMTLNTGTISSTASNFILDAAGELHLDADDGIIRIRDDGGDYGMFQISNSDFIIRSMVGDKDLIFKGNDGGSVITALTLDMSEGGNATFSSAVATGGNLTVNGNTNLIGNLTVDSTTLYVDSSNNSVGIGTTTLNKIFNLADPAQGGETLKLHFEASSSNDKWAIYSYDRTNSHYTDLSFGANYLYLKSGGNVGIGVTPQSSGSGYTALQIAGHAYNYGHSGGDHYITNNAYITDVWRYSQSSTAQYIQMASGLFQVFTAAAGTAGNAISWNRGLVQDSAGKVGIGTTNPAQLFHVTAGTGAGTTVRFGQTFDTSVEIGPVTATASGMIKFLNASGTSVVSMGLRDSGSGSDGAFRIRRGATLDSSGSFFNFGTDGNIQVQTASGVHRSRFDSVASHALIRMTAASSSNSGVEFYSGSTNTGNITGDSSSNLIFEPGGVARMSMNSTGTVFGDASQTADGMTATPNDINQAEIGPGYLRLKRDDTANAQQLTFDKNGATHSYIETRNTSLAYVVTGGRDHRFAGGNVMPDIADSYDLGTSALRWRNGYFNDFHLSNEGIEGGNDVDGTTGDWTIQEGEEHLYIINNKTGKKFRFALEEVT